MDSGIRATVTFPEATVCPVARVSAGTGGTIHGVSSSVAPSTRTVSEFLIDATSVPESVPGSPVLEYGEATVYRVTHEPETACPCVVLGREGCPPHHYRADNGRVTLVFHARDVRTLQRVMAGLQEVTPRIDVQRLLRPPFDAVPASPVHVDRSELTARQLDVLRAAYDHGYFERPKGANASEVATELGISQSTFSEHLMVGLGKLLEQILDDTGP